MVELIGYEVEAWLGGEFAAGFGCGASPDERRLADHTAMELYSDGADLVEFFSVWSDGSRRLIRRSVREPDPEWPLSRFGEVDS